MTHANEGMLLALRDGESIPEGERAHIMACAACDTLLEEARLRADLIRDALGEGAAPVDVERAKAAVRARLDESRGRSGFPVIGSSLRRAAAILLLAAGAVSALQAPPVRTWLADRFAGNPADGDQPAATSTGASELRSIWVEPRSGLIIALSGVEAGTRLAVVFEARDDVEVSGAEGTRFSIAENRVAATDIVGPVIVRVPEGAPSLTISADGRMMFMGTDAEHEVHASGVQADGGWVFRIPQF